MAKAKSKSAKDSVTLSKNGFIVLVLFTVAVTMLAAYAYLNFTVAR